MIEGIHQQLVEALRSQLYIRRMSRGVPSDILETETLPEMVDALLDAFGVSADEWDEAEMVYRSLRQEFKIVPSAGFLGADDPIVYRLIRVKEKDA